MTSLAAIILCGGTSRRMGRDKALLPIGGESMLQRVVRLVGQVVPADQIVCVAAIGQPLPQLPAAVRVVHDRHVDRGPLEGLATGLAALYDEADAAFVTTCDAPLLMPPLITHLLSLLGDHDAVIPVVDDQSFPLSAVYRIDLLGRLDTFLERGGRRVIGFAESLNLRSVPAEDLQGIDAELLSLRSCNTIEEYEALLRLTAEHA